MSKEIYISSTPHETRLAIVENDALTEIYYERENEYTLAGSIYNGKVTRVLPGMQSSFVDIGLDRDAFLYITDFMEEAGDAADFEANANGGGSEPRPSSREGGRGDRGGRSDRGPRPTPPAPREPSDADLFTEAVSGIEPSRPAGDSERGERSGSRRGGRNRRDRNSDGTPRRDRVSGNRVDTPPVDAVIATPTSAEDLVEPGEGAPGADGSRRWRGRRGRRGNRGSDRGPASNQPQLDSAEPHAEQDDNFAAPPPPIVEDSVPDRGDRNRRDRTPQPPRAPRGFAPSADLYQVEGAADPASYGSGSLEAAPVEPLILPGESLSKYRAPAPTSSAGPSAAQPAPAPASDFVAAGWDGGFVLPGETIRPRTPSPSGNEPRRESGRDSGREPRHDARPDRDSRGGGDRNRGGRDRGGSDRGGRDRDRGPRQDRPAPPLQPARDYAAPAASQPVHVNGSSAADEPEPQLASHPETRLDTTFVAPPPMPAVSLLSASAPEPVPTPVVEVEYEPSEASASYRVDPAPPSEFRQSAPAIEEELFEEEVISEPVAEPVASFEPVHDDSAHEFTSIFPTGEMHSEPVALTTQDLVAPAPSAQGSEQSSAPVAAEIAAADQTVPWFAPGTGLLEEEVLEDEDEPGHLASLQARNDPDPQEQETLENAADLGSMLREMSIDHLTRSEAAVDEDEDDDLEEDFLEEDQDYELDVSESDEFEDEGAEESAEQSSDQPEYRLQESGDREDESALEVAAPYATDSAAPSSEAREPRRDSRGRRDGRRGDRNRRSSDRDRDRGNAGSDRPSGERSAHGRSDSRGGRQSMQSTNLPAISDLLKPGQEILVQIAKEPIAKKGARITSHIALPGRFLVFMPTVNHIGVSRKIESDGERRRLKEVLLSEKGDAAGGFIVRTAASGASEEELRSDLRFLLNLWTDIKTRSDSSKSPALIYHDLSLVERVLRDQVTDNFSAIWVDTESDYERILRFLQRFQPTLIRRVKLYTKEVPLFEQFGITEEINKALRSKVWLKSGGSIVINQTEALVAIDINTGKFVGKTARLEDTIVKTNLDAIPEIVRQIRLRDLGGIIIIDFIDMDERKNRNKVMAALEDELKNDRAPSKVLPFNDFGLVAITRKRVKQSLERTLSTTCNVCQGTGMVKSPITVCNDIYIEMRKMHKHLDRGDVMLRVHPEVVKQLKSSTSRWLQEMEEMVGKTILVKSDPSLHPEQFDLH